MIKIINIILLSSLLFGLTPIHDQLDTRIKGKSFGGSMDDNRAVGDGLGIVVMQHLSGTRPINNELIVNKLLRSLISRITDTTLTDNVLNNLNNGTIGTAEDIKTLNTFGFDLNERTYISGTLSSCKDIKRDYPASIDGIYSLKNIGDVYCDMTTDGGGWTRVFYQNYGYSVDSTTVNILSDSRSYYFNYQKYEEIPKIGFDTFETLVTGYTGSVFKVKFTNPIKVNSFYKSGTINNTLSYWNSDNFITVDGYDFTTNQVKNNIQIYFYSAGAIFGEWSSSFDVNGMEWWVSNDTTNVDSRFRYNGIMANSVLHYSSILVR